MDYVKILLERFEVAIEHLSKNERQPGDDEAISLFRMLVQEKLGQEEAYSTLLDIGIAEKEALP